MSNEASAQGLGRLWFSTAQLKDTNFFNKAQICPAILNSMKHIFSSAYAAVQSVVRCISNPGPSSATVAPEESLVLESQPTINRQATDTNQELASALSNVRRYYENSVSSEVDNREEAGRSGPESEQDSAEAMPLARSKRTWMWVMALIIVILFMIMLPGLILGLVTMKIAWALAISGAVAPAVVFFAGLYYHHNK